MVLKMHSVMVRVIPEKVTAAEEAPLLRELQNYEERQRPRLVLDCSRLRRMDTSSIRFLLSCLEEAMKRNGNVKLASLRPLAHATLKLAGVHRLFEIYPTTAEATRSYQRRQSRPWLPPATQESPRDMRHEYRRAIGWND